MVTGQPQQTNRADLADLTPMERYLRAAEAKHTGKATDAFCGDYDPTTTDMGDHVCVHCATCGVVLDKRGGDGQ